MPEKPGLEDELLDLRMLLESDQITEEEFERREKEMAHPPTYSDAIK